MAKAAVANPGLTALIEAFDQASLERRETILTDKHGHKFVERLNEATGQVELVPMEDKAGKPIGVEADFFIEGSIDERLYKIQDGLFIGSQDAARNLEGLRLNSITHILNVATGIANAYEEEFVYKTIRLLDIDTEDISVHVNDIVSFIEGAVNSGGNVLVHCNAGISRSTSACIVFLIARHKMTYNLALQKIKAARACVRPNPGFERQLRELERRMLG